MSLLSVHELTEMPRTESLGLTARTGPEFAIHILTEMPRAGPLGWTVARTAHQFAVHTLMKMPRALDRVLSTRDGTGIRTQLVEFCEAEFSFQL